MTDSDNLWGKHTVPHGEAEVLFPVDDLDADVVTHRDAELRLQEAEDDDILTVTPTSMASGYFLGQHTLTAIPVDDLSDTVRESLPDDIASFRFIRVGKRREGRDRSLSEYADTA